MCVGLDAGAVLGLRRIESRILQGREDLENGLKLVRRVVIVWTGIVILKNWTRSCWIGELEQLEVCWIRSVGCPTIDSSDN